MAQTEGKMPNLTSRFFVENHSENGKMVEDLNRIEDFVDRLTGKGKKVKHFIDSSKNV